ncbi:hypothetical protein E2986_01197 [Frieseomelitta varia]|uniref:UDENN domain-containing protein n=1 Tax=Frieseomelitta varia TaxID=561572 RepID=A0A833RXC9_9HYME|nr:hypothetical protein E2986_01197 [Frieseomelitta varia]
MSVASCSKTRRMDTISSQEETIYEKWERFHNWVHCICIVTFDLELGQAIEAIYPSHIKLSEQERSNICYLAFPDSNSGCMGDTQYHVRIRQNGAILQETKALKEYDRKSPSFLQCDRDYYWGYVYFRQVKDKSLPRGYFQKSIVIITKLPFVNLFGELCALIAPEFFEMGNKVMEAIVTEIDRWPSPTPGQIVHLPLLGVLFQTYIPNQNYKATAPTIAAIDHAPNFHETRRLILTSAYEGDMFRSLANVVSYVHLLWELVLLSEPIVVMAGSPTGCSEMVQALIAMIAPLKYCADHRPYFTIHDSEFKEYTTDAPAPPAVILGVTNPFFAKTLQHWPHIIRISNGTNNGIQTKRPGEVQTALLKRHLIELTESFMIPLERYIASLMPLQKDISPFKVISFCLATPIPELFNPDDFLATLSSAGPQLTTGIKGDWVGLYRRFFRSPNFSGWFYTRHTELSQKLEVIQLEALSQADLKTWVQGKQEVELVDMILRIRQKLEKTYIDEVPIDNSVRVKLQERINDITHTLPDDLKDILKYES